MEFADAALAKFLETSPELSSLIVNFSDISHEMQDSENGSKIGVFLLKTGIGPVTVPVIMKNESIFPIDSVFVETESKFRPLSPSTVNYLINSVSKSLGKMTDVPKTFDTNPNLQNLINPPRTGKFNYASTSRLTEFLASLPNHVKQYTFEKISAEQSIYKTLDNLFGLKAIFEALNGTYGGTGTVNSVSTGPESIRIQQFSVVTTPEEVKALMNDALSKTFIDQGYVVTGGSNATRTAIAYQPYNTNGTFSSINYSTDQGKEFNVTYKDGTSGRGYIPKFHQFSKSHLSFVLLEDGNYATGEVIYNGEVRDSLEVLNILFHNSPPKLLRELERNQDFILFTNSGEVLGPFNARSVTRTAYGVEVNPGWSGVTKICGYQNFTKEIEKIGETLFVPSNILVYVLGVDVRDQLECNVNNAAKKKELIAAQYLHSELDLRHDGIEFSAGGKTVGNFPLAMKFLVEQENIDPDVARSFLKQAEDTKFVKIFLSKKASTTDFNPAQVPQYGAVAPQTENVGLNGSFIPSIQSALPLQDSQTIESVIIAELLKIPDLFEYIQEYLPEIEDTVDKLGRMLFLTRIKIDQLSKAFDSDSVFSVIGQLKTVYRQLGDTSLRLKGLTNVVSGLNSDSDKVIGQNNDQ